MKRAYDHRFLTLCQLLVSLPLLVVLFTSPAWQQVSTFGKVALAIPAVYGLLWLALAGHYWLRKKTPLLTWGFGMLFPLLAAGFTFVAFHMVG